MKKVNVCIVLPYPVSYSETFLQAHIDRLGAAVSYLQDFPIDVDEVFPTQPSLPATEKLKRQARICLHRFVLNSRKKRFLRKLLWQNRIDIVLAEYGQTGAGILKACKDLSLPLIVHFHGNDAYSTKVLDEHRDAYKRMFEYASAIIAVSKHMEEQLVSLGAPREKIIYNPYGVEVKKFPPATVLESPPRVLSVGRFVEKKAPYLTILAFAKVLERLPEARLVMVGTGLLYDVCSKLVKALHLDHAVELMGVVNHEAVATLMQNSRVFVQHSLVPSSGDTEGTPVAILEAGASGVPVVSTNHAGISEVVVHGKTGFLVDEGDIDAMAEFLYRLLRNSEVANEMGRNAREHISANFRMEQSIRKLQKIIESCVICEGRDPNALSDLLLAKSSAVAEMRSEPDS